MNPAFASVAELSAAFVKRTLSPVDVVDVLLVRIERTNRHSSGILAFSTAASANA